jgi:glycosyltransferase involved in cell wall biosynthesis
MKILMILSKEVTTDDRVCREAKALIDDGNEVTVIVWDRHRDYEPESIVYGIAVERMHNKMVMRILPNDLLRNPLWWRRAYKKGLELYKTGFRFDIVHCHDLDTLQAGAWLKKKLGVKLIYDAHEIFGYMIAGDMTKFVVNIAFKMEKKMMKHVDHIITVNEQLKEYFRSISKKPITVVMNCKDMISEKYKPPRNHVFTVSHIGNLHRRRLFPEIIDVLGGVDNIRFVIAAKKGNMKLYQEVEKAASKYDNVDFLGEIPFDQVVPRTFEADVVLYTIDPAYEVARIATPNKLFEAMVCGRPIVCTRATLAGKITEELQSGLVVEYEVSAIKGALLKLRDDPALCEKLGRNALNAAETTYNWSNMAKKLLKVYKDLGYEDN